MLIVVHYGNASLSLVNGNCRSIHLLNYTRTHCCLSSSIKFDLCSINTGEPFHLSSVDSKSLSPERHRSFSSHVHCVLTQIDEEGTYSPLLNDPTLLTNEFLAKLKRATSTKINSKTGKKSNNISDEQRKGHRNLRSFAIATSMMNKSNR